MLLGVSLKLRYRVLSVSYKTSIRLLFTVVESTFAAFLCLNLKLKKQYFVYSQVILSSENKNIIKTFKFEHKIRWILEVNVFCRASDSFYEANVFQMVKACHGLSICCTNYECYLKYLDLIIVVKTYTTQNVAILVQFDNTSLFVCLFRKWRFPERKIEDIEVQNVRLTHKLYFTPAGSKFDLFIGWLLISLLVYFQR